jgi:hypothetical protein
MTRTTLDIDDPVLEEVKRLKEREGRSLGQVVSHLLSEALSLRRSKKSTASRLVWKAQPMGARVDLTDKDALYALLEEVGQR